MAPSRPNRRPLGRTARALRLAVLIPLARLRFLFVLAAIALVITQWETLLAYARKVTRPAGEATVAGDVEYFCPMHPAIVRETNREKCPICFMPLAKRHKGDTTDDPLPAGTVARVQLSPYRV